MRRSQSKILHDVLLSGKPYVEMTRTRLRLGQAWLQQPVTAGVCVECGGDEDKNCNKSECRMFRPGSLQLCSYTWRWSPTGGSGLFSDLFYHFLIHLIFFLQILFTILLIFALFSKGWGILAKLLWLWRLCRYHQTAWRAASSSRPRLRSDRDNNI